MPLFIIERNFADQIEANRTGEDEALRLVGEEDAKVARVNEDVGIKWIYSFLSADKKKSYCLYEAPSAEHIREAARRLDIPADVIVEVSGEVRPHLQA